MCLMESEPFQQYLSLRFAENCSFEVPAHAEARLRRANRGRDRLLLRMLENNPGAGESRPDVRQLAEGFTRWSDERAREAAGPRVHSGNEERTD
jgi:hypothetical protein